MLVNVKKPPWPLAHMNTLALTPLGGNETNLGKRRERTNMQLKWSFLLVSSLSPFFLFSVLLFFNTAPHSIT